MPELRLPEPEVTYLEPDYIEFPYGNPAQAQAHAQALDPSMVAAMDEMLTAPLIH